VAAAAFLFINRIADIGKPAESMFILAESGPAAVADVVAPDYGKATNSMVKITALIATVYFIRVLRCDD